MKPVKCRRGWKRVAAGWALVLPVVLMSACGQPASEETAETRAVLTVELVSPRVEVWPQVLTASGEVSAWQEAIVGAEVSGVRLQETLVEIGDVVNKGQLLARYNEDMLRARLARLDAALAEAEATDVRAQADLDRADRLEQTAAVSRQVIEDYRTGAAVSAAQLASVRAQREAQALELAHARVVAPDDGVISSRSATLGGVSTMGEELFRLVRQNRLEWRAELPADAMPRLQSGATAELAGPGGETVTGTLRQLSPTVNPRTRNGIAYVDLPVDSGLAAGMYVSGRFLLTSSEALALPQTAVVLRDGNQYLVRIDDQQRARRIKITTGRRHAGQVEILEGATRDQRFVKAGGAFLSDGDRVDIVASGS